MEKKLWLLYFDRTLGIDRPIGPVLIIFIYFLVSFARENDIKKMLLMEVKSKEIIIASKEENKKLHIINAHIMHSFLFL